MASVMVSSVVTGASVVSSHQSVVSTLGPVAVTDNPSPVYVATLHLYVHAVFVINYAYKLLCRLAIGWHSVQCMHIVLLS